MRSNSSCLLAALVLVLCLGAHQPSSPRPGARSPAGEAFEETPAPPVEMYDSETLREPEKAKEDANPATRSDIDFQKLGEAMRAIPGGKGEAAPGQQPTGRRSVSYWRTLAALLIVLALILFLSVVLRRFGKRSPLIGGMHLGEVLGRIYLTPRASLHFLRAGGRVLVIGVSPNQVSLVAEFDAAAFETEPKTEETTGQPATGFARFLSQWMKRPQEPAAGSPPVSPEEAIASLRKDIQQLQEYLKEAGRRGSEK